MSLAVARGLEFPDEYVVYKAGILATSGAGKSNVAVVLAEEMWRAGLPWVAIDPKGDWYGMRASADAKKPGLPVPILGGLHGDVPLEPGDGRTVARMIASRRMTCIVDVSEFDSLQEMWRFLTEFAQELLRVNREPLHVFAEEAADYLPQTKSEAGWLPRCVNAWRRVVSHGRNHGVGITLISQRSAKIDKEALDLVETLIAMRATSKRDRDAIKGWVETHDVATELVDSLPELEDGEAWVWSPHRFKLMQRVKFRRRSTFDSGATPLLAGVAASRPASIADVDLAALKDEFSATIEKAEADDPERLKAEVARLKRELAKVPAPTVETIHQTVYEPFVPVEVGEHIRGVLAAFDESINALGGVKAIVQAAIDKIESVPVDTPPREAQPVAPAIPGPARPGRGDGSRVSRSGPASASPRGTDRQGPTRTGDEQARGQIAREGLDGLDQAARRVLAVLYANGPTLSKRQIALLTGYSVKASTIGNAMSKLRAAGLAIGWTLTESGMVAGGRERVDVPPQGPMLVNYWLTHPALDLAARTVLGVLLVRPLQAWSKTEIAEATGYSEGASTIGNAMSKLRSLGLVDGWRVSREFEEAIQ